jgi:hypothetical protein
MHVSVLSDFRFATIAPVVSWFHHTVVLYVYCSCLFAWLLLLTLFLVLAHDETLPSILLLLFVLLLVCCCHALDRDVFRIRLPWTTGFDALMHFTVVVLCVPSHLSVLSPLVLLLVLSYFVSYFSRVVVLSVHCACLCSFTCVAVDDWLLLFLCIYLTVDCVIRPHSCCVSLPLVLWLVLLCMYLLCHVFLMLFCSLCIANASALAHAGDCNPGL